MSKKPSTGEQIIKNLFLTFEQMFYVVVFVRYGTLPKGARIGAYLESLRQSGMGSEPPEGVDMNEDNDNNKEEEVLLIRVLYNT